MKYRSSGSQIEVTACQSEGGKQFETVDAICSNYEGVERYHQRGSLEHTLFGPFPRLVLVCINADFCDQGRIFPHFSSSTFFSFAPFQISVIFQAFAPFFAKFAEFFVDFQRRQQILQIFVKFQQIFPEFCRISTFCKKQCQDCYVSEKSEKICRNFAKFRCKIAEILSEKMYALNVFDGDTVVSTTMIGFTGVVRRQVLQFVRVLS